MITDEVLDKLPVAPGVYLFRDGKGHVIYVGKAKSLRARVRQYFRGGDERFFVAAGYLADAADSVETVVVSDEKEALLLENHLVKAHQPKFNVKLRDDKQYLVLRVMPPAVPGPGVKPREIFPRVEVVRNIAKDAAHYFGPYHSATSARQTLRVLNRHFQLRTCTDHILETRGRVCLQYQIKRCPGPCAKDIAANDYKEQVEDVRMFLSGKDKELVGRLKNRMQMRAESEDFESAALLRDSITAVERTLSKQHVVQDDFVDQDIFGLHREGDVVDVVILHVRAGKLIGKRSFHQRNQELPDEEVLTEHLARYYSSGTLIPDEVVIGATFEDPAIVTDWLSELRGKKVKVIDPRRGTRVRLLELANKNAAAVASSRVGQVDDVMATLEKVAERLRLKRPPRRIECFDIAHISGTNTVASMVVLSDGAIDKARMRTFNVKGATNDDFASMHEVITRRYGRAATQEPGWEPPDLLVIDGGKGQLASALAALTDVGFGDDRGFDVVGLAKERELSAHKAPERVFFAGAKDAMVLRANSPELYLLTRARDEAHRVANTFHRKQRSRRVLRSSLDDVPGIGPKKRKLLLTTFGSVAGVAAQSIDTLTQVSGISLELAQTILRVLQAPSDSPTADVAATATSPESPSEA